MLPIRKQFRLPYPMIRKQRIIYISILKFNVVYFKAEFRLCKDQNLSVFIVGEHRSVISDDRKSIFAGCIKWKLNGFLKPLQLIVAVAICKIIFFAR